MINKPPGHLLTKVLKNCVYSRNVSCQGVIVRSTDETGYLVLAEDSEVTDLARSPTSSTHSRGELLELTLLVPTWIIICSGFLRKSGLIRSVMSCVVHPGNVAILTCKFLDILWLWRYFSEEYPAMIIFFRRLGCG